MDKKIGFDVSETITRYPEQCKMLIESLHSCGWVCFIVSPNEISSIYKDLESAGIDKSMVTILNTGHKGQACKDNGVCMLLDDNPGYLGQCLDKGVSIMPLQVLRI